MCNFADGLNGYLTSIIAAVVAVISFVQYRNQQNQLKLQLFEKRYIVYEGFMEILRVIQRDAKIETKDQFEFYFKTKDLSFLFKDDIINYKQMLLEKIKELQLLQLKLNQNKKEDNRSELSEKEMKLLLFFSNELITCEKHFHAYMSFKNIK
jgi:hypothetical protein